MNKRLYFLSILTFKSALLPLYAQFYTISADTARVSGMGSREETLREREGTGNGEGTVDDDDQIFWASRGYGVEIERDIPVFVNVRDSIMKELLHDRLNVCLPLDFLRVNSNYGYRTDPVYGCTRYHDGIDLHCHYSNVYSMLPAKVKEVHFGNRGYGNYVILEHGNLECLYGHLSKIYVWENQVIPAGTVVAVSGNTGKSTGPHLHIRLEKDGKSVNPKPFIDFLSNYIIRLQDKIRYVKFGERPPMDLSIANHASVLERHDVSHPRIAIAQTLLETGY